MQFSSYGALSPIVPLETTRTQSNLETSLCSYVTGCFRIKSVLKQPVQFSSYRAFGPNAWCTCLCFMITLVPRHCSGDQPTTNTQSNLETSLCSYITGHFRINTFSFKKKVQSNHGVGTALSLKGNSRRHACEDNINT